MNLLNSNKANTDYVVEKSTQKPNKNHTLIIGRDKAMSNPFRFEWRVHYHETDQQGFVYHSRYLEYLDMAMIEYFRSLGWAYSDLVEAGFDPSVVETTIKFKAPARFDDQLSIFVSPCRVGSSSFSLTFSIRREPEAGPILRATTAYVNVDVNHAIARHIPKIIKERMALHIENLSKA